MSICPICIRRPLQIHPYVNGILYSILAIPRVRAKANDLGMEAVLEAQIEQPQTTDDTKQLPFVLKQLRGGECVTDVYACTTTERKRDDLRFSISIFDERRNNA